MIDDVSLTSNDHDLNIVYGPDFFPSDEGDFCGRETALGGAKYIFTDIADIKRSFFRLGFHLHEFDQLRYYEDFGFSSLADFCAANLGMDPSAVSRCVNVFLMTCNYNGMLPTMFMSDRYKGYSYSQLSEMLSIPEKKRIYVDPSMTVKEIREFKKSLKTDKSDPGSAIDFLKDTTGKIATSQESNNLCVNDLCQLKGAALAAKIKKVESDDVKHVTIFSESGKKLLDHLICDILLKDENNLILRVCDPELGNDNTKILSDFAKKIKGEG